MTKFQVQFSGSNEWISISSTTDGKRDTEESVARHALTIAGGRDPGKLTRIGRGFSTRRRMACSRFVLVRETPAS